MTLWISRSCEDLCIQEFSAARINELQVEFCWSAVARILTGAVTFTEPETAVLPAATGILTLPPTREDASRTEVPSRITPSAGTVSPAYTSKTSPALSSLARITETSLPLTRFAFSARSA